MKVLEPSDDEQLLRCFLRSHDPSLFRLLFERTVPGVLQLARAQRFVGAELEDFVQEVYLGVLTGLHRHAFGSEFGAWVRGIARNKLVMRRRRLAQRGCPPGEPRQGAVAWNPDPAAFELRAELREAIASLPPVYRVVVELRYLEELAVTEIADRLGTNSSTVRSRLSRGLDRLRRRLRPSLLPSVLCVALLAELARRASVPSPPRGPGAGRRPMVAAAGVTAGVACLTLTVGLLVLSDTGNGGGGALAPSADRQVARFEEQANSIRTPVTGVRASVLRAPALESSLSPPEGSGLRVRFVDVTGHPIDHLVCGLQTASAEAERDPEALLRGFRPLVADAEGSVVLEDPPEVPVRFQFSALLCIPPLVLAGAEELEVPVPVVTRVRGRVRDRLGEPVGGAEIWCSAASGDGGTPAVAAALSGADGEFEFALGDDSGRLVWALQGGDRRSQTSHVKFLRTWVQRVGLVLRPATGRLVGTIRSAGERPIAGALVAAQRTQTPEQQYLYTRTDDAGTYAFGSLLPGEYELFCSSGARPPGARGWGWAGRSSTSTCVSRRERP